MRLYTHTHTHTHTDNLVNKKGITLVALVVTIVVLLILAGVSINLVLGQNGLITNAKEAKISQEFSTYKEKMNFFIAEKKIESENFNPESITAYKEKLYYNTKKESDEDGIEEVLGKMSNKYLEKIQIIKGEIYINTEDKTEIKVAQNTGIKTISLDIVDGTLISSNKNLELKDEEGTIIIPPSVKKIGEGTFSGVKDLKKIIIPGTVEEIGSNAFSGNALLKDIVIEEGVKTVGRAAFSNCTNLKSIKFPDSVIEIGASCMQNCQSLENIKLSKNITIMNSYVVAYCTNLKSIEIPENVESIGGYAFEGCSNLEKIQIPAKVALISGGAFWRDSNIKNIVIDPKNENFKFENGLLLSKDGTELCFALLSLKSIVIPDGVTKIKGDCLSGSIATSMTIPNSIKYLGGYEFTGTENLKEIKLEADNQNYKIEDGNLYSKNGKTLIRYLKEGENIIIPEGVITIMPRAIQRKNVKSLSLPSSLEEIKESSLNGMEGLEEINIPENVKPFWGKSLPGNIKIKVSDKNQYIKSVDDTMVLSKDGKVLYVTVDAAKFVIPNTVETLYTLCFYGNNKVKEITIPNSVKEIQDRAFGSTKIESIIIPESVEIIGENVFYGCNNLNYIKINKKKNSISGSPWGCQMGERIINWQE